MQIPELEMEEWLYTVSDRIKQIKEYSNKAVIHISGASASGKTFSSLKLVEKLGKEGHRCLLFSTDNYYKGLSRMMAQKVSKNFFDNQLDTESLASHIRSVIKFDSFNNKFSSANIEKIKVLLTQHHYQDVDYLVNCIFKEFQRVNFDEPDAVNLARVAIDINILLNDATSIIIPEYSMITSEVEMLEKNRKFAKDYDVIILEGIYSLNDEIVNNIDPKIQIKTFLDADNKTLLVRRLKRDIIDGRSSMTPETNLYIALDVVIPAFEKHILNDKKKADMILLSKYTLMEAKSPTDVSIQEKIKVSKEEVDELIHFLKDYEVKEEKIEEDYYFANSYELDLEKQHLIRVRLENNQLYSLVHKSVSEKRSDGKIVRPQQVFISDGQFKEKYQNIDQLIASFNKSHFHILCQILKKRTKYRYQNVSVMVDRVDGLGYFLELCVYHRDHINEINLLKEKLGLKNKKKVDSYFEEKMNNLHTETELKFILPTLPPNLLNPLVINQKYLDISIVGLKDKIEKIFSHKIEWSKIVQIRLRNEDNDKFFLTLKSDGEITRDEIEKQVDFYQYKELLNYNVIGEINKKRYFIDLEDNLKLSIDVFENNLILAEVEYDLFKYREIDIENIVKRHFNEAKNVTFDKKYKNLYLALNKE